MKKVILLLTTLLGFMLISLSGNAQTGWYNRGTAITILSNTTLTINGDYQSSRNATVSSQFFNGGTLTLTGDFINEDTDNLFDSDSGLVVFNGVDTQFVVCADSAINFFQIEINKPSGDVVVSDNIRLKDSLTFVSGNLELRTGELYMYSSGMLINENETARVFGDNSIFMFTGNGSNQWINSIGIDFPGFGGFAYIRRGHNPQADAGNGGIERFFIVTPTVTNIPEIEFRYLDAELGGLSENSLELWTKLSDNGWRRRYKAPDTSTNFVSDTFVTTGDLLTYIVTASDTLCTDLPVNDLGPDTLYMCGGESVVLELVDGMENMWNTGETTRAITVTTEGTYWGRITNEKGCAATDRVVVINMAVPNADFTMASNNICLGEEMILTNTSRIDSGAIANHYWDFIADTMVAASTPSDSVSHFVIAEGSYDVRLIAISEFGCSDTTAIDAFLIKPLPQVSFTKEDVCLNEITEFNNTTPQDIASYSWDYGDGTIDPAPGAISTKIYTNAGDYIVKLVIQSQLNCYDSITQIVTVHDLPVASFTATTNCENVSTVFTNTSSGADSYMWDYDDGNSSMQTSPTYLFGSADDYNVELWVETTEGCTDSITQTVEVDTIPVPNFTFSDVCDQVTMQFVNTSTKEAGVVSYLWDFGNGSSTSSLNASELYDTPQNYSVKLLASSSNGCSDSIVKVVTVNPNPVAQFVGSNECVGDNISFNNFSTILSGTFSSAWDFGNGASSSVESPNYTYSADTTYTVQLIVNSDQGCKDTLETNIDAYPIPFVNFGDSFATCGSQYIFDAKNAGSTYLWSDNSTNQTFTTLLNGTSTVTITSANNCVYTEEVIITLNTINDPGLPDTLVVVCDTVSYDVFVPSSTFIWSDGTFASTVYISSSAEYLVTIEDQNKCFSYDSVTVVVNISPVVALGNDTSACAGDNIEFDGKNAGATYLWSDGSTNQKLTVTTSDEYWVYVSDANNCFGSDTIQTTFNTLPVINIATSVEVCDEAILDAQNPGASYLWSTGETSQTLLFNTSGNYSILVTDTNSCFSSVNFTVNVNPVPAVSLGGDVVLCNGETQAFDVAQANMTFLWSDATTDATNFFGTNGTVWVEITNSLGCSSRDTSIITVDGPIELDLGIDKVLCSSRGYNLDAGTASIYSWSWDGSVVGTERYYRVTDAGSYSVEVESALGCTKTDTIIIGATSPVFFAEFLVATTIDVGEAVQFVQVSDPEPISQRWVFGDGSTSTDQHPEHTYYIDGDYNVMLIATNENCIDTIIKPLTVVPFQLEPIVWKLDGAEDLAILNTKLYPNPTQGQFNLNVELNKESDITITIFDLNGQIICREGHQASQVDTTFVSETMHNHSELGSGLYFVSIGAQHKMKVLRFIKQD
ncbi:MAG: PKD domain-containing protein [Flavobacteriales bacterium]|nr:PKD domain-containing protein [Flavobacteriales bacterium]